MSAYTIYKTSSRIQVQIGEASVWISPLSVLQKMELNKLMITAAGGDMDAAMEAIKKSLRMCLKDIKGVATLNDQGEEVPFTLQFQGNELSDECLDDLLNLPFSNKLTSACTAFLGGVPTQIMGTDGNPLEGVSVILPKAGQNLKK